MYTITITNDGGKVFPVRSGENEFSVVPGGPGTGPLDYFLAGLGTCVAYYLRIYCDKNKIEIPVFAVTVTGELTKERPVRFESIEVAVDFKGAQVDETRKGSLLDFIRNCPAHNTLKGAPKVEIHL